MPDRFRTSSCRGVSCTNFDRYLLGSMQGPLGPILQVQVRQEERLRDAAVLFFDETGRLVSTVSGRLYFTLPDGNLLVSDGMTHDGSAETPWYGIRESIQAVTPTGRVVWRRLIDGPPGQPVVTTANGNLVLTFLAADFGIKAAGVRIIDPATGRDVVDTFVDSSFLCRRGSANPICVESEERALARFAAWWDVESRAYGSEDRNATTTCSADGSSCTTATLQGWSVEGDVDVLQAAVDTVVPGNSFRNQNVIVSFRSTVTTRTGGIIYRKLGPDRFLVSRGMADSGSMSTGASPWYNSVESLAILEGGVLTERAVGGKPALAPGAGGDHSAGVMLADGNIYWTAASTRGSSGSVVRKVLDLTTLQDSPPANRQLEGLCFPRGARLPGL